MFSGPSQHSLLVFSSLLDGPRQSGGAGIATDSHTSILTCSIVEWIVFGSPNDSSVNGESRPHKEVDMCFSYKSLGIHETVSDLVLLHLFAS